MTPEQWERAKEIFDAALDLDADERAAYVRSVCSNEPTVFTEVENLLLAHAEIDSEFLKGNRFEAVPTPAPSLHPGEVVSGRFRIIRPLGDGGMGQVYEAHDSELGVQVALKTLRPEIADNPEVLTRFRQEVRIAHRITHSNVCRTFQFDREIGHIGPDGSNPVDLTFITMEFLDGETLQQILKRTGRLTLDRAQSIATQMAEAIEAAHHTGIVHRDIKPGNVMICPGKNGEPDRVVVTDFGLAKNTLTGPAANRELSAISHPGRAIGTVAYMAPEQVEDKRVSPATDIYAFGLVLYEMVTGQKAFPSASTPNTVFRRLSEEPPSPRAVIPALPAEWDKAILGCLQIDPADRFQHATDVIAIFEGADPVEFRKSTNSRSSASSQGPTARRRSTIRRRWMLSIAAAVLLCVSLSWPAYRLYESRANSVVVPGTLVYLAPVKNETGEKQLDNITELVQAGLSQSAHINLLDAGRVSEILQRMTKPADTAITPEVAREIAMRANAPRLITAVLSESASKYSLLVTIEQPDEKPGRPRHAWPRTWTWEKSFTTESHATIPSKLLETVRDASDWIRSQVGESANDIVRLGAPPEDVTTRSWEALEDYEHALNLSNQGQRANAVVALQQAVQKDPQFASAYAMMGDLLLSLHREIEGFQSYDKALDSGLQNRLTRREEDRIRGMRAADTADYQLAIDAFHDYTINYKNDYTGWVYPTRPLRMLKRDDEAIANLHRAIPLLPKEPFAPYALATELIIQGRQVEAMQWIQYLENEGESDIAGNARLLLCFVTHRYADAQKILRSFQQSANPMQRSYSYAEQADLSAELGQYADAIHYLDQGMSEDSAQNNNAQHAVHLLDKAYLECKLSQFDACLRDARIGYGLSSIPRNALRSDTILGRTYVLAPKAFRPEIRRQLHLILSSLPKDDYGNLSTIVRLRTLGEIQLASDNPFAAIKSFRIVATRDAPIQSREYLARALVAAAAVEPNRIVAANLQREALADYADIAFNPAYIWCESPEYLPGMYSDELGAYLEMAGRVGVSDQKTEEARSNFKTLRKNL